MEVAVRSPVVEGPDLIGAMDGAASALCAAFSRFLSAVAVYDDERLWLRDDATSMTAWLAARYGLRKGTARELVRVARRLRRLPAIAGPTPRAGCPGTSSSR